MDKLINISQLCKLLNLVNPKTKKPYNYILRYWEKQFHQIKPTILKKRRYYSEKQIRIIKLLKYDINSLDDYNSYSLKADYLKENIKTKSKNILEKIKKLKN